MSDGASDAMLSVEVIAKMDALGVGLKTGAQHIVDFVTSGNAALKDFEATLNGLGVNTSAQGIKGITAAIAAQRLENEKLKGSVLANKVAQESSKTAIQSNADALGKQKVATEAQRTTSANLTAQLNALRLANMQNRSAVVAASGSYDEANQKLREMGKQIRSAADGFAATDPAIVRLIADYRALNTSLQDFDSAMGNNQRRVGSYIVALDGFRSQLSGLIGSYFSLYAAIAFVSKVVSANAEISDGLSDVQRTAGLTAKEVDNLAVQLKKIDTRTSLQGLLAIATIGGQLGISKDQLAGFTKAIDQLSVALGGELKGGAEGIAGSLGVLNKVFGISAANGGDVEKSFNQIGSAILSLGQSGLATGDYLSDFGQRVGGIAAQAGLSLPVLLSYGAVLQENGVSAEVAGTSFKKLIGSIATKREKFLAVAQIADASLTLKEFTNIINTDTQKALQLFFNGLEKGGPTTTSFLDLLKSIGLDAGKSGQSIAALSLHQGDLVKHIAETKIAYEEGTLGAEQFKIKNDNLAGSLDKLSNAMINITTNPNSDIGKSFKFIVEAATDAIRSIDELSGKMQALNDRKLVNDHIDDRIPLTDPTEIKQLAEARARLKAQGTAALNDNIKAVGTSNAQTIIAGIKDQTEFTKVLRGETKRLSDEQARFNYNLAYIKDPKNVGAPYDAAVAKTNKLRSALATQQVTVKELAKAYEGLYGKPATQKGSGVTLPGKEDKKLENQFAAVAKQVQDFQNKSNLITKEGLAKDLQEWDDNYKKIKDVISKLPAGPKKDTDSAVLNKNYEDGKINILQLNSRKIEDLLKKRRDDIAAAELGGQAKDIDSVNSYYAGLVKEASGNNAELVKLKENQINEIADLTKKQTVKDNDTSKKQLADIAKDFRDHQADMYILAQTDGAPAVETAENEKAKNDLKQLYASRLIDYAGFQSQIAVLIKKGNTIKSQPPIFDTQHFSKVADAAKQSINATLQNFIDSGIANGISSSFEGMGKALADGGNILTAAGEGIKNSFAQLMGELGKQFIILGTAKVAAALLLTPFGGKLASEGAGLIALGAGLSLGGGLISGGSSASGSKSQGSTGTGSFAKTPAFAMGVQNFGGGLAIVGERGPEIVTLPTGSNVMPNHKVLQSIASGGSSPTFVISNQISMGQLVTAIKKQERSNSRT